MGVSTSRNVKSGRTRVSRAPAPPQTVADGAGEARAPELSDPQLRQQIVAYVEDHPGSDAFDIGVALGLSWRRVKRLAGDLVGDGQLVEQE